MPEKEQRRPTDLANALAEALQILDERGEDALESYLAQHASAPELRQRLRLLADSGMIGGGDRDRDAGVPERLGEFELREKLGGGGMGVVFRAFQPSLGRDVALKLIRPEHLYFDQARERFRREVEAVARLEHSGIVRVYAAGEEGGVPFFVMELVEGLSLDRLLVVLRDRAPRLDEHTVRSTICEALGRPGPDPTEPRGRRWPDLCCRWVCDLAIAVDHAHRHGVLHRDLKPSNVMVTPEVEVKLLDFGLANTRESASITRSGSQLGSVPYMAPEQLAGEIRAIDERTDVYGLGVTLHELLTFQSPFMREGDSEENTRRRILDAVVPSIRSVNPLVSWDAETVCSVAMDREPERRYPSAAELAADLHNVLELRTITAKRPSAVRRLRRWAQRRPAWAVGLALGSLLLVVGPTAFGIRERIVRDQINEARRQAEEELDTQVEILRFLNEDLLGAVAPDEVGRDASMRAVLDIAADKIESRFPDRPLVRAALHDTIGSTYRELGELDRAEAHLLSAIELFDEHRGPTHEQTLKSRRNLAGLYRWQDRLAEAEVVGREIVEALASSQEPRDVEALRAKDSLALTLIRLGQYDEAEGLLSEVVEGCRALLGEEDEFTLVAMSNLGLAYYSSGRYDLAEPWWRRELEITKRRFAGTNHPDLLVSLTNWANLQDVLGNQEEADTIRADLVGRSEAVYGRNHPETILTIVNFGVVLLNRRHYSEAERWLRDALSRCVELPENHERAMEARAALARVLASMGRVEEGMAQVDELLRICRTDDEPSFMRIVQTQLHRATLLMVSKSWAAAEEQCREALDLCETHGIEGSVTADLCALQGQCLRRLKRFDEAAETMQWVEEHYVERAPLHHLVGLARRELARIYRDWGKPEEAAHWQEAARAWQDARTKAARD